MPHDDSFFDEIQTIAEDIRSARIDPYDGALDILELCDRRQRVRMAEAWRKRKQARGGELSERGV